MCVAQTTPCTVFHQPELLSSRKGQDKETEREVSKGGSGTQGAFVSKCSEGARDMAQCFLGSVPRAVKKGVVKKQPGLPSPWEAWEEGRVLSRLVLDTETSGLGHSSQ